MPSLWWRRDPSAGIEGPSAARGLGVDLDQSQSPMPVRAPAIYPHDSKSVMLRSSPKADGETYWPARTEFPFGASG